MVIWPPVAEIKPFRALRYDEREAGPLADLVAPPYDVIGPEERESYLAKSPYNVVHLTLPDSEAEAGRRYRQWQDDGVLIADEAACWALSQHYVGPDGVSRTRTGLVASLEVEPYEAGVVLPHERTHRGPKEGRLRLLREVRAQLEPIFLLYEGEPPFAVPEREPDLGVEGASLWRLDETSRLIEAFADKQLLIADGHHRYETALAYHEETGTPESGYMLVVLVSVDDPGLQIFPTHRLAATFNGPSPTHDDLSSAMRDLESRSPDSGAAVLYRPDRRISLLTGARGQLDVEVVEAHADDVTYTPSLEDAVSAVDSGRAAAAFLVRPTRIEDVFAVAKRGETMPQKSTYFYPKLVSGLLFHPLEP
jgi:uncharacterized protein (DUF1015 family)